jgi:putative transposase
VPTRDEEAYARARTSIPTERVRARIELFAAGQPLAETLEQAARLSVRLVIQAALEAEVAEFLGRDRYQRDPDAAPGYRNGYQPRGLLIWPEG